MLKNLWSMVLFHEKKSIFQNFKTNLKSNMTGIFFVSAKSNKKTFCPLTLCILYFAKPVWAELNSHSTIQLISAPDHISQEGNKCTTTKEKVRAYCPNIWTVKLELRQWRLCSGSKWKVLFKNCFLKDHSVQ